MSPSLLDVEEHRRQVDRVLNPSSSFYPSSCDSTTKQEDIYYWKKGDGLHIEEKDRSFFEHLLEDNEKSQAKHVIEDLIDIGPGAYGEITTDGARKLFHAMGMTTTQKLTTGNKAHANGDSHNDDTAVNHEESHNEDDNQGIIFYDLGSGTGKIIIQSYLELERLKHGIGVELAPSRHEIAINVWEATIKSGIGKQLRQQLFVQKSPCQEQMNNDNHEKDKDHDCSIQFIQNDILEQTILPNTTHIYLSSLCFTNNMMKILKQKLLSHMSSSSSTTCDKDSNSKLEVVASLKNFDDEDDDEDDHDNGDNKAKTETESTWLDEPTSTVFVEMSWTEKSAVYIYNKQHYYDEKSKQSNSE